MSAAIFGGVFRGARVLVTGDTGFKGSWLAVWLLSLGANVSGVALEPDTTPALFSDLELGKHVEHLNGDIRDAAVMKDVMRRSRPDVVLHLAAQPLVLRSYDDPVYTFETNAMGTVNVLEAVRLSGSVSGVVVVTTDKVYRNAEQGRAFKEDDPLGGLDPYSASKACTELIASSYGRSFLHREGVLLATARAGNVIGGGDWASDRIVPDCVRALASEGLICVRNPGSVRPWQHVLEPLSGYLQIAALMIRGEAVARDAFNFGPDDCSARTVEELVSRMIETWGSGRWECCSDSAAPQESRYLQLDSAHARDSIGWRPVWSFDTAVRRTADWYRAYLGREADASELLVHDIEAYVSDAIAIGLPWAISE